MVYSNSILADISVLINLAEKAVGIKPANPVFTLIPLPSVNP